MKHSPDFKPTCKCGAELKRLSTNVYPNFTTIYYDCKQCGIRHSFKIKKDGTVVEHREIGVRDHPHRTAHRQMKNNQTICWDCKNAIGGGCSWFTDFTPVAGWKAKRNGYMPDVRIQWRIVRNLRMGGQERHNEQKINA